MTNWKRYKETDFNRPKMKVRVVLAFADGTFNSNTRLEDGWMFPVSKEIKWWTEAPPPAIGTTESPKKLGW